MEQLFLELHDVMMSLVDIGGAEERATQMSGVIEEFPSQDDAGRVQTEQAAESVLGGDGEHGQKDDGQLGVGVLSANGARQSQNRA